MASQEFLSRFAQICAFLSGLVRVLFEICSVYTGLIFTIITVYGCALLLLELPLVKL